MRRLLDYLFPRPTLILRVLPGTIIKLDGEIPFTFTLISEPPDAEAGEVRPQD